jgi:hypothetical protein
LQQYVFIYSKEIKFSKNILEKQLGKKSNTTMKERKKKKRNDEKTTRHRTENHSKL